MAEDRTEHVTEASPAAQLARVFITDLQVIIVGHAPSKPACVAISAAIQTATRIAGCLELLDGPALCDHDEPRYAMHLLGGDRFTEAAAVINGLAMALHGISQVCPNTMLVNDGRKRRISDIIAPSVAREHLTIVR